MAEAWKPSVKKPERTTSPLIEFRGRLKEYKRIDSTFNAGTPTERATVRVQFDFTDLEVIKANEPYPHKVASITLNYSERPDTMWAAFAVSVNQIINTDDVDLLIGKMQRWQYAPTRLRLPDENQVWDVRDGTAWQVQEIEGYETPQQEADLFGTVAALADGKTDSEFYAALLTHETLRLNQSLVKMAIDRSLLSNLETSNMITQDSSKVWHKV